MSPFINTFRGKLERSPPVWFMRQAGRYLPEYRHLRNQHKSFLSLCYTPEDAACVTLQPLERFDLDVAIIFSDILVIPDCLGQKVIFVESEGPRLAPLSLTSYSHHLSKTQFLEKAQQVYEALSLVKSKLSPTKTLMGFAGAPWTLALYMLEGRGSCDFSKAKEEAFLNEAAFSKFLHFLVDMIVLHVECQIQSGAGAIQLFDSWAGLCPSTHFQRWVIEPTRMIVERVQEKHPDVPIIGFPRGGGTLLADFVKQTKVSGLSLDSHVSRVWVYQNIQQPIVFQGNLDPLLLVAGGDPLREAIHTIHTEMRDRPYIFNLGHGILPQTPPAHVESCVQWVKELR